MPFPGLMNTAATRLEHCSLHRLPLELRAASWAAFSRRIAAKHALRSALLEPRVLLLRLLQDRDVIVGVFP
jgi:hypothetical protein